MHHLPQETRRPFFLSFRPNTWRYSNSLHGLTWYKFIPSFELFFSFLLLSTWWSKRDHFNSRQEIFVMEINSDKNSFDNNNNRKEYSNRHLSWHFQIFSKGGGEKFQVTLVGKESVTTSDDTIIFELKRGRSAYEEARVIWMNVTRWLPRNTTIVARTKREGKGREERAFVLSKLRPAINLERN